MGGTTRVETGFTFDGFIREFQGVRADNFSTTSTRVAVYLLSHSHADHLKGLDLKNFQPGCSILCSKSTYNILKMDKVPLANLIFFQPIEENVPIKIALFDGQELQIVAIPSYHCPGSVMFLLESESRSVLYTGDIRAEDWWVRSLKKNPFLAPYFYHEMTLDNVYLDTTFGYRGEPYIKIASNSKGVSKLRTALAFYPIQDPDIAFYLHGTTTGFEEIWLHIAAAFNTEVCVPTSIFKLYKTCAKHIEYGLHLANVLKIGEGKFNVGMSPSMSSAKFPITVRPGINIPLSRLTEFHSPVPVESIDGNDLLSIDKTSSGAEIVEFRNRRWLLFQDFLLPQELRIPFSRHSSYLECIDLVSALRPLQVYPCTESKLTWIDGFQMKRIFGDHCEGKDFIFDIEKEAEYGRSPVDLAKPVELLNEYSAKIPAKPKIPSFNFKGQLQISEFSKELSQENQTFLLKTRNLNKINKMYIGRSAKKCDQLISKNKFKISNKRKVNTTTTNSTITVAASKSYSGSSNDAHSSPEKRPHGFEPMFRKRWSLSCMLEKEEPPKKSEIEDEVPVAYTQDHLTFNIFDTHLKKGELFALDNAGAGWFNIQLKCIQK